MADVCIKLCATQRECAKPPNELLLNSIIVGLLQEGRIRNGSLVDAGAADGRFACWYAKHAKDRIVHAIDPDEQNVKRMHIAFKPYPNLHPMHGALSDNETIAGEGVHVAGRKKRVIQYSTYRLDNLFRTRWPQERLALAHFDVEGFEPQVLLGSRETILRDSPVVTTEVTVHGRPDITRNVLSLMDEMDYDSFLVEEICGQRADIRNVIHFPRAQLRAFEGARFRCERELKHASIGQ